MIDEKSGLNLPTQSEANLEMAAQLAAVRHTLVDRGIISQENLSALTEQCRAAIDQALEDRHRQYREAHPEEADAADLLKNILGPNR